MRDESPVGSIVKGGQPTWSFDMQGMPPFWIRKADELHRMVELGYVVWRDDIEALQNVKSRGLDTYHHRPSTLSVSFFLASLAIENLLKAILIREHPEYISGGRFRDEIIGSHNLREVAIKAGLTLTEDEEDFCELGTESILNFGRYHIGKNANDSPTQITLSGYAFSVYERFFNRLKSDLEQRPFSNSTDPTPGSDA